MSESFSQDLETLKSVDATTMLGNHLFVIFQVAAGRLTEEPPRSDDARLLIDTAAAMLQAGQGRLGSEEHLYQTALTELQQLYVRATTR
jgi:hypothetical protein